jgi:hypothetical protein
MRERIADAPAWHRLRRHRPVQNTAAQFERKL